MGRLPGPSIGGGDVLIRLRVERSGIKDGMASHSPELRMTSGGRNEVIADANLVRATEAFFRAYSRWNSLAELIDRLHLDSVADDAGDSVTVELIDGERE